MLRRVESCSGSLETFGGRMHAETSGEGHNGSHDLCIAVVFADSADKGAVDLQGVCGQSVEVAQGRVAGAKVVEMELDPGAAQLLQLEYGRIGILHDHALGDLEAESRGSSVVSSRTWRILIDQVGLQKLTARQVDVDGHGLDRGEAPDARIAIF